MSRSVVFGLVAVLAVSVSGCGGDDPDSLMKQSIADMNAVSEALEKKESPEKLKAAVEKMKATNEKFDKLPKEKKDKLAEKYKKELEEAGFRLLTAAGANPNGEKALEDVPLPDGGDAKKIGKAVKP